MSERCFHGDHFRFLLGVGIPGTALVCVGVPLFIIRVMSGIQAEGRLTDPETLNRFGFIFYGYRDKCSWWEVRC